MMSTSFVTSRHALLAPALQMARQIKLDANLIRFALLNRFESVLPSSAGDISGFTTMCVCVH